VDDARQLPVSTTPEVASTRLKSLADGDIHSFEQQPLLILRSLHDSRQGIPLLSRLKLERMHYSASTAGQVQRVLAGPYPAELTEAA
jgi:hypothetical protein